MRLRPFLSLVAPVLLGLAPPGLPAQTSAAKVVRFQPASASPEARAEVEAARFHWRNAFPGRAIAHLNRALQLDPELGFARIVRAGVNPAMPPAERQVEFDKGIGSLAHAPAGDLLLGLAWREQFAGRGQVAGALFDAAVELYPGDPEVTRWASTRRRAGKSAADVAAEVRRVMQLNPDYPLHYHNLGYALFNSGDRAGGIAAMREFANREPTHPNAPESLAELLLRDGKSDEAVQVAQRALAVDSAHVSSWSVLADVKLNAGDLAGARSYWTRALQLAVFSGDSVDMMHTMALSYLTQNDPRTAMTRLGETAALAEAKYLTARAALLHQHMALVDAFYGDGRGVSGHLAKAAQLGGSSTAGQLIFGAIAYTGAKQLDSARASATRFAAVATDANRRLGNMVNGFNALQAGDGPGAGRELALADQNDPLVQELLAELQMKQGQQGQARVLREQVLRSATILAGGRVLDPTILIAKQRAKTL
jgi:tetratricopeptide (TPR) repeat protein